MSMYVKKNGVVKRISGVPRGWNAVKTFNVPSSLWEANQDAVTSADYPYIAEITTDYFSNDDSPQWQMNGVGDIPVGNEIACCDMIRNAIFLSTGVVLYATDLVTEDLVLETGMFAKGYSSSSAAAADISYDGTDSGISANRVQGAIDALAVASVFTIEDTDWVANQGTDATDFPYVAEISTTAYSATFHPSEILILGADPDDYPTDSELEEMDKVDLYVKFTATAIRLRATDAPSVDLSLVVRR